VKRGAVHAEAALRAVLTAEQAGTVEVLPTMSHSSLQAAYAGAGIKGERGETVGEGQAASAVVITTDAVPSARVAIEEDAIVVMFLDWQAPSPPLVVLVPDDERSEPRTPDLVEGEGGAWTPLVPTCSPSRWSVNEEESQWLDSLTACTSARQGITFMPLSWKRHGRI